MTKPVFTGILFMIVLWTVSLFSQETIFSTPLSPRIANYDISVNLDVDLKMLDGKEVLQWHNTSTDTITELQFHLYLNAFKNTQSSFLQESGGGFGITNVQNSSRNIWGWIDIDKMTDDTGNDLTTAIQFIQPDDNNLHDQTVAQVILANPLMPGQSIRLTIDFTAKIPEIIARTGYGGNYFFIAQWFPKIGVYEPAGMRYAEQGQWNCHQYHAHTEFYADFGVYNVDITVPSHFVVGATGSLQRTKDNGATTTYFYRAEDVWDFSWTASPDFVEQTDSWNEISIRLLSYPEHTHLGERQVTAVKYAFEYFEKYISPYPYPTLTIVCPPFKGIGSGFMEYATLFTTFGFSEMPLWLRSLELVTIHEFAHQYFMGMLSTNEFEEAWLDEGFTTYFESRIMDHYYGAKTSIVDLPGYHFGSMESYRDRYLGIGNPKIAPNAQPGWAFKHGGYSSIQYAKTSTWLKTLEGIVGISTIDEIFQTYFQRWKFRHPSGEDFIAVANEIIQKNHGDKFGENMDWFFDQVVYGTDVCDYELASITNTLIKADKGIFTDKSDWKTQQNKEEEGLYDSKVVVHRLGELVLPVELLIYFENGDSSTVKWNGEERSFEFNHRGPSKIDRAIVDPELKNYMDKNVINNSLRIEKKKTGMWKYACLFLLWLQNVLQSVGFLV